MFPASDVELVETTKTNGFKHDRPAADRNLAYQRTKCDRFCTYHLDRRPRQWPPGRPGTDLGPQYRRTTWTLDTGQGGRSGFYRQLDQRCPLDRLAGSGSGISGHDKLVHARVRPRTGGIVNVVTKRAQAIITATCSALSATRRSSHEMPSPL